MSWLKSQADALRAAVEQRDTADDAIRELVKDARAWGVSWATLGEYLGTSKQAAWEKYGRL